MVLIISIVVLSIYIVQRLERPCDAARDEESLMGTAFAGGIAP